LPAIEVAERARLSALLTDAVREAGALALSMFGTPIKNWTKAGASPVSEADIAADRLLHARLPGADAEFGWLSEESTDDPARLAMTRLWIVDPIDGTRAYLAGLPDWTVSAALVEHGRPVVACLFAPVTEELFVAVAGQGARRNGEPIAATSGNTIGGAQIAGPRGLLQQLATATPPFIAAPRIRSLALRLARVAQGTVDAAFAGPNSHDWDLAAADLLVHEAGGALTPLGGGAVTYNRPVPRHDLLVAAGRDRHAMLIDLLGDGRLACV
jgi:myo-inositol-1(or 4)-monophosphatase